MTGKQHRWKPGESGNPKGRKPGQSTIAKLRENIATHVPQIVDQLVEAAKGGDVQAARLLLERVLPPVRAIEQPLPIEIPEGTLTEKAEAVLRAVGIGQLAPAQGSQLLAAVATLAKVQEIDELERRIAVLEGGHESKS